MWFCAVYTKVHSCFCECSTKTRRKVYAPLNRKNIDIYCRKRYNLSKMLICFVGLVNGFSTKLKFRNGVRK